LSSSGVIGISGAVTINCESKKVALEKYPDGDISLSGKLFIVDLLLRFTLLLL
jgi:hypothetical protein